MFNRVSSVIRRPSNNVRTAVLQTLWRQQRPIQAPRRLFCVLSWCWCSGLCAGCLWWWMLRSVPIIYVRVAKAWWDMSSHWAIAASRDGDERFERLYCVRYDAAFVQSVNRCGRWSISIWTKIATRDGDDRRGRDMRNFILCKIWERFWSNVKRCGRWCISMRTESMHMYLQGLSNKFSVTKTKVIADKKNKKERTVAN